MPFCRRTLVVGTTSDYIHWIDDHYPGTALFLTTPEVRGSAAEPEPPAGAEIVCPLSDYPRVRAELAVHLAVNEIQLDGVACFDCESMDLAADLASRYGLPYPSQQTVTNCRNKLITKTLWRAAGVNTPAGRLVGSASEAIDFLHELDAPLVLKPLSGSGSELIFSCADEPACERNFGNIQQGLERRSAHLLYQPYLSDATGVLAEKLTAGHEYSSDFILDEGQVRIIRMASKIPVRNGHFGITLGYRLLPETEWVADAAHLEDLFGRAARALGIRRAVCMLDFIVDRDRITLLEIAPRPGGDCLPPLIRAAQGVDIIKLTMDFSRRQPVELPVMYEGCDLTAVRLLAGAGGILTRIDPDPLRLDHRVRNVGIARQPGHLIRMPPEDFDSWVLGHFIFAPERGVDLEKQCVELRDRIDVEVH